jgi:hypothetical protein
MPAIHRKKRYFCVFFLPILLKIKAMGKSTHACTLDKTWKTCKVREDKRRGEEKEVLPSFSPGHVFLSLCLGLDGWID